MESCLIERQSVECQMSEGRFLLANTKNANDELAEDIEELNEQLEKVQKENDRLREQQLPEPGQPRDVERFADLVEHQTDVSVIMQARSLLQEKIA